MAQLVYKPKGNEPQSWPVEPDKMLSPEVMAIERLTKMTFAEWGDALGRGSITALHALLYVLLKREHPVLRPDDLSFSMEDIDIVADEADESGDAPKE